VRLALRFLLVNHLCLLRFGGGSFSQTVLGHAVSFSVQFACLPASKSDAIPRIWSGFPRSGLLSPLAASASRLLLNFDHNVVHRETDSPSTIRIFVFCRNSTLCLVLNFVTSRCLF